MEPDEWAKMCEFLPPAAHLELNLSCPNVHDVDINDTDLRAFVDKFDLLQVKIRPTPAGAQIVPHLEAMGVKVIHMSNTIPAPKGGISGKQLKDINLPLIENAAKGDATIIAGGGIYTPKDIEDYRNAGAKHFSVSTVFLSRPMALPMIYNHAMEGR